MENTEVTKRKAKRCCSMCSATFHGDSEFSKHDFECALKDHLCGFCIFTSQKASNVKRRIKRAQKGWLKLLFHHVDNQLLTRKKKYKRTRQMSRESVYHWVVNKMCKLVSVKVTTMTGNVQIPENFCSRNKEMIDLWGGGVYNLQAVFLGRKHSWPNQEKRSYIQEAYVLLCEAETVSSKNVNSYNADRWCSSEEIQMCYFQANIFATELSKKTVRKFKDVK